MRLVIQLRLFFSGQYWKSNWKKFFTVFSAIVGGFWTITELYYHYTNGKDIWLRSEVSFWIILGSAALLTSIICRQKTHFRYRINNRDINISVVIGNVFSVTGDLLLATNSTFDTTFRDSFISENSIQGQLFKKFYSEINHLDSDIDGALKSVPIKETLNRTHSKVKRYEIGTAIKLLHKKRRSYWVAMSDVNEHGKPSSSFADYQVSLERLWHFIGTNGHIERLVTPILGSGKTGLSNTRTELMRELILSFIAYSRSKKITEELTICIHPKDYVSHLLDMTEICKYLEYSCQYHFSHIPFEAQSREL